MDECGERMYDNQDVMFLLKISPRTLQRYRLNGYLKFHKSIQSGHKIYYKESDLLNCIKNFHSPWEAAKAMERIESR